MTQKKPDLPTKKMDSDHVKSRGLRGILYFLGNSSYAAVLGLVANLFFTIYLTPAEYGLYFIVLSLNTVFSYFTDLGLAAALVQKKSPVKLDYHTAFTIQLALISMVLLIGVLLSPLLKQVYDFDHAGIILFLAMLFSLFILSLKSVPSTILERKLDYGKIVFTQALESSVFYITSIVLMFLGYRIYALVIAVILRAFTGVILIYYFTRWRPRLNFQFNRAKAILSFGIPFQANVLLAFVKDDLLNLWLAKELGLTQIGYIGWAKKWAEAPLRIVTDNVNRVLFPIFSKYQSNKTKLRRGLKKTLFFSSLILMPVLAGAFLTMPYLIQIIPKYQKWAIAVPSFNFFLISALFISFITPFINVFNSMGKVKTSVKFMLLWIVLNWTVVPLLTKLIGFQGVSIAFAINSLSFVIVVWQFKQYINFRLWTTVKTPLISTVFMLITTLLIVSLFSGLYLKFAMTIIIGLFTYIAAIYFFTKGAFVNEIWQDFWGSKKPRIK